jgi:release factor glutamine methyltransferase
LFSEILNCDRAHLYLNQDVALDKEQSLFISATLERRFSGEPLQYILGKTEFMGLEFKVTPDVFIPRPETEILVETALKLVSSVKCQVSNILDLGTGSGCIAVSLARFLPRAKVDAIDISEKALAMAKYNAWLNNAEINFIQGDLFNPTDYDLIITNPPYIPSAEIDNLQPEIQYEPRIALDGGRDGLDFYRRITACAPGYLKEDGFLIMEMGFGQRPQIENIFQKSGNFEIIEVVNDYNNIERVIVAKNIRKDG